MAKACNMAETLLWYGFQLGSAGSGSRSAVPDWAKMTGFYNSKSRRSGAGRADFDGQIGAVDTSVFAWILFVRQIGIMPRLRWS